MHGINYSVSLVDILPSVAMATKVRYILSTCPLTVNLHSLVARQRQVVVEMSNFSGGLGLHNIEQQ